VRQCAAAIAVAIAALLMPTPAAAQSSPPSTPGPYVIDIRAPMSGLPSTSGFHPVLPANTLVPKRGFGLGVGGHVHVASLGVSRVGVGLDVLRTRGTAVTPVTPSTSTTGAGTSSSSGTSLSTAGQIDVAMTMTAVAPQLSFNFGTREGWSYLSGGYGVAQIRTEATGEQESPLTGRTTLVRDDGRSASINYGGGARWFIRDRVAVGFDLRFHRIAAVGTRPVAKLVVASVGLSVR
jgi:hypothetical protein